MEGFGFSAVVIVAALLSVGLIQAIIGVARADFGLSGSLTNVFAVVVGILLAVLARVTFPAELATFTYAQVAVVGGLNGLASTGLWRFRNGAESTVIIEETDYSPQRE